jgi:hypothetical protein
MKHTGRIAALVLVLAAVAAASAAASGALSGTYVTTVKSAGRLNGTYQIKFSPGHFFIRGPYGITGNGTYSISHSWIWLKGPGSCKPTGEYTFKISGSYLSFHKYKDPCPRAAILTAHAMKRT